jgi:hypothetical protein
MRAALSRFHHKRRKSTQKSQTKRSIANTHGHLNVSTGQMLPILLILLKRNGFSLRPSSRLGVFARALFFLRFLRSSALFAVKEDGNLIFRRAERQWHG